MKKTIKVAAAEKRIGKSNPGAVQGLLDDFTEEVHVDEHGAAIPMVDVYANVGANNNNATSSPARVTQPSPAAVPATNHGNKDKEERGHQEETGKKEAVAQDPYPTPEIVKQKMGQHVPDFVCLGEGEGGLQFVQFLYRDGGRAQSAARHLNQSLKIARKDGSDNRVNDLSTVTDKSTRQLVFPVFAKMKLFRVTIFINDYRAKFGPTADMVGRKALENQIALREFGDPPPYSNVKSSATSQSRNPNRFLQSGSAQASSQADGSNVPLSKASGVDFGETSSGDEETLDEDAVNLPVAEPLSPQEATALLDEDEEVVKKDGAADEQCRLM